MKVFLQVLLLAAVLSARSLTAGMIFDNGTPNGVNGDELTIFVESEDFTLASSYSLTDVRFWAFEAEGSNAYQGSIAWSIYADNAGTPGAILYSGTATATPFDGTDYAAAGCCGLQEGLQLDFSVGAIPLAGGTTYHLGLHNGPLTVTSANGPFFWSTTYPNSSPGGLKQASPFGSSDWTITSDGNVWNEHAFQLLEDPVPEPATFGMLGAGLLGLAAFARRRLR